MVPNQANFFWAPCLNWIGATGHTKTAKRQLKVWDLNNLSTPLETNTLDQASSVLQPMYDNDIGVLYLVGKGDGTISYYELVNDDKKIYFLSVYRNPEPQKGGGWVGKKGLDVWKCEVARFLKLTSKSIIPISFIVPRKSGEEIFQADVYPDAFAGKPALTSDEWVKGQNKSPILMSLDPSVRQDLTTDTTDTNDTNDTNDNVQFVKKDDVQFDKKNDVQFDKKDNAQFVKKDNVQFVKKRSYEEVIEENNRLKERVKELEIKLGIHNSPTNEDDQDMKVDDNDVDNNNNNDEITGDDNNDNNIEENANKSNENIVEDEPTNDNDNTKNDTNQE